tara:strand:+ start:1044 stop:1469 length:426 start_codon:yes stop_codon:yes gene_type:complete
MFFYKKEKKELNFKDLDIAICTLLIHAARTDEKYEDNEKKLIKNYFIKIGKDKQYIQKLIHHCEIQEKDSIEILNMTKIIKKIDYERRLEIIEIILKIIYSDQQLCQYEDRLIRKVAGLIYIESKDLGEIRIRIKNDLYSK